MGIPRLTITDLMIRTLITAGTRKANDIEKASTALGKPQRAPIAILNLTSPAPRVNRGVIQIEKNRMNPILAPIRLLKNPLSRMVAPQRYASKMQG
tara:strand:+ start:984 stop:1271 length:288 start_codon:yes stop_codon:yes gene_type:complete